MHARSHFKNSLLRVWDVGRRLSAGPAVRVESDHSVPAGPGSPACLRACGVTYLFRGFTLARKSDSGLEALETIPRNMESL